MYKILRQPKLWVLQGVPLFQQQPYASSATTGCADPDSWSATATLYLHTDDGALRNNGRLLQGERHARAGRATDE